MPVTAAHFQLPCWFQRSAAHKVMIINATRIGSGWNARLAITPESREEQAARVPFIHATDEDQRLIKVECSASIVALVKDRRRYWQILQYLSGGHEAKLTAEDLMRLPGVGPAGAARLLACALGLAGLVRAHEFNLDARMTAFLKVEPNEAQLVIRAPLYLFKSVRFPVAGAEIDARDGRVAVEGWNELTAVDALELAATVESWGVVRVQYTDVRRDGTLERL